MDSASEDHRQHASITLRRSRTHATHDQLLSQVAIALNGLQRGLRSKFLFEGRAMNSSAELNRFVLPIRHRQPVGTTTYEAKDPETSFPPISDGPPPSGAPNGLIVPLDVGFGGSSAFGRAVNRPTADRLAADSIKLSRLHTTAPCAPSSPCPCNSGPKPILDEHAGHKA